MKFMERDDRNALRYERELRKKYLKQFNKKTTTTSQSPGFEKFKRQSVMQSSTFFAGFNSDHKLGKSMGSAKDKNNFSSANPFEIKPFERL